MIARLPILIVVPLLAACSRETPQDPADTVLANELVVITPHDRAIQEPFGLRFSLWHEKKTGQIVTVRWIQRGTLEAKDYIYTRFEQYPGRSECGVDVFFGGGAAVHRGLAEHGYSQPVKVPDTVLAGIPKYLNGQLLYAEDGSWHGTALGGFGILYNKKAAAARGLPAPRQWADLAAPAYQGWVAAADPATSGSTTQCLVLAMLKHGWVEGWGVLMGLAANCNGLLPSSQMIGGNVSSGMAVAGLEAEFVARMALAGAPEMLEYVNPAGATVITPDPVTVLKGAPNQRAAEGFVEFVLSTEGQVLWGLPAEAGGPSSLPLYRYPIRPEVYEKFADQLIVKGNPFKEAGGLQIDPKAEAAYTRLLPALFQAACGKNHFLMQQAWAAARREGDASPKLAALRMPPFDESEAMRLADEVREPARAQELIAEWSQLFQEKYLSVLGKTAATATAAR